MRAPARINCELQCEVPAGVTMAEVPPPRHDWGDVLFCPNGDCGRCFLITKDEEGS